MKKTSFFWLACLTALTGCASDDQASMQAYMDEVRNRPPAPVDPLPDMDLVGPYLYSASNFRSPFDAPEREVPLLAQGLAPEQERPKEALEAFPLDSLEMVGTIERGTTRWAILLDTQGLIYRATIGDRLGKNHGKVTYVSEQGLELVEIVPDARGGWREREAKLDLRGI